MNKDVLDLFSIEEAAILTGLRRPMLDHLCRSKIVVPSRTGARGRGRRRLYSFGDLLLLRVLARMLSAGVSVKRACESFKNLNRHCARIGPMSSVASYLITDGERVYLRESNQSLEDLAEGGQLSFMFVFEFGKLHRELCDASKRLRNSA